MIIMNNKFNIDDEVWICFIDENDVGHTIVKTKIDEILLNKDGISYYIDKIVEPFNENEVFDNLKDVMDYLERYYEW